MEWSTFWVVECGQLVLRWNETLVVSPYENSEPLPVENRHDLWRWPQIQWWPLADCLIW